MLDKQKVLNKLEEIKSKIINGGLHQNKKNRSQGTIDNLVLYIDTLIGIVSKRNIFSYFRFMTIVDDEFNKILKTTWSGHSERRWIKQEMKLLYQEYKDTLKGKFPKNSKIIFRTAIGSQAYGLSTPTSDVDIKGVYIQHPDDILSNKYIPQIEINKDEVYYELRRFLELLSVGNPNVLELLYVPDYCVFNTSKEFKYIKNLREEFLSKVCCDTFSGYAKTQLQKAKGLNKKFNWEADRMVRKDLLDFCQVIENGKSIPFKQSEFGTWELKFWGATKIPKAKDTYALYYDENARSCFSDRLDANLKNYFKNELIEAEKPLGFGYKGLVKIGEDDSPLSNQLRLSSVPKDEKVTCTIVYNKDGYTEHCKDYGDYQKWLIERNETRVATNKNHGQKFDGKNIMHTVRLVMTAQEIPTAKKINVFRGNDRDFLLSIKHGEIDLETIINQWSVKADELRKLYSDSNLKDRVDVEFVKNIELKIRKKIR